MKKVNVLWVSLLILALLLSACRGAEPAVETPTQDPNAVFTAAAETASANMTETASAVTPTPSPTATETPAPPTPTFTATVEAPATAAATTAPAVSTGGDRAQFVSDVTIPDDTVVTPGQNFTKTWRLVNEGTTTWTTGYSLRFLQGDRMDGQESVNLTSSVAPGSQVDVSVSLTAPDEPGTYTGYWQMANAQGELFQVPFYVRVVVSGTPSAATGTPGATATTGPTATGGVPQVPTFTPEATSGSSAGSVSDVILNLVGNSNVTGDCPVTFNLSGNVQLSQASSVTYVLEAESETPGFNFTLPGAVTANMSAGNNAIPFELELNNSVTGQVRLHVTAPQDAASEWVNFSLTCE